MILSFGLLGPARATSWCIDALPAVVAAHPKALFVLVGATHPDLLGTEGEAYRDRLVAQAKRLGIARSRPLRGPLRRPGRADPLARGRGRLRDAVPAARPDRVGDALVRPGRGSGDRLDAIRLCERGPGQRPRDPRRRRVPCRSGRRAQRGARRTPHCAARSAAAPTRYSRRMVWSAVGAEYRDLFAQVAARHVRTTKLAAGRSKRSMPDPAPLHPVTRVHLDAPHRRHRDHAARGRGRGRTRPRLLHRRRRARPRGRPAASARARLGRRRRERVAKRTFLDEAFDQARGRFRNFRRIDGSWLDEVASEDSQGRAMLALGWAIALARIPRWSTPPRRCSRARSPRRRDLGRSAPRRPCCSAAMPRCAGPRADRPPCAYRELAEPSRLADCCAGRPTLALAGVARDLRERAVAPGADRRVPIPRLASDARCGLAILDWLVDAQTDPAGHLSTIGNGGGREAGSSPSSTSNRSKRQPCYWPPRRPSRPPRTTDTARSWSGHTAGSLARTTWACSGRPRARRGLRRSDA